MRPLEQAQPASTQTPEEHLSFDQIDAANEALDARLRAVESRWGLPSPEPHREEQSRPDLEARGITVPQRRTGNERHFVGSDRRFDPKDPDAPSPVDEVLFAPTTDRAPHAENTGGARGYDEVLLGGNRDADQGTQKESPKTTEVKAETPLERFVALNDAANEATRQGALESSNFNEILTGHKSAETEDARNAAVEAVVATGVQYKETRRGFTLTGPDGKQYKVASRSRSPVEIVKAAEQVLRAGNPDSFETPQAVYGHAMDFVAFRARSRITDKVRNFLRRKSNKNKARMVSPDLMEIASTKTQDNLEGGATETRATFMLVNAAKDGYYENIEPELEYATQQSFADKPTLPEPVRITYADRVIAAGDASRESMRRGRKPLRIAVGSAALLLAGAIFMPSASQSEAPQVSEAQIAVVDQDQQHFFAQPTVPEVPQVPAAPEAQPETKTFSETFDSKSTLWGTNARLLEDAGIDADPATIDSLNRKMLQETGANQYNLHAGSKVTITFDQNGKIVSSHADLR